MARTDEDAVGTPEEKPDPKDAETPTGPDSDDVPKKPKAPATRRNLTGAELQARFDGWRDERRAKRDERTPEDTARTLRRGAGTVVGAGALALVVAFGVLGNSFETEGVDNDERIAALEAQVADAEALPEDTGAAEKLITLSETAAADAKKVAEAQQAFAGLYHRMGVEPDPGNGAPNHAATDMAEHRRTLAPFFDEGSYAAEDEDAYTWQNVMPFDEADEIDPRFAWYVRYDGSRASNAGAYTWTVETVTPDLDTEDKTGVTNSATVVWLCRETKSDEALAWARADYAYDEAEKSGTFRDLDLVITAAGAKRRYPSVRKPKGRDVPERGGAGAKSGKSKKKDRK
ncbi:hypothetical protein [Streptomyces sp. NPDC007083]|uniref:hypothetical protein n=1 Tax=Streptomyces sp. NPDC007083 TaxID=3156913 RepID=UPI0033C30554